VAKRIRFALFALILVSASFLSVTAHAGSIADSAILFIGDGMGPNQIVLGRAAGGGDPLAMERMSYSGLVTTVSAGGEITDSAAASTALSGGYKTGNGVLGMTATHKPRQTILERSLKLGKSTGVITDDSLTGATPAGFVVHIPDRDLSATIAEQETKSGAQVMMGYGRDDFVPRTQAGKTSGADLVSELRKKGYEVVFTRDELMAAKAPRLVGLFDEGKAPTLQEMVKEALARLNRSGRGFFLVVEQAWPDWKEGDPSGVALDVLALDKAVATALDFAQARGRTLVVVTSDHETGNLQITSPARLTGLRAAKGSASQIAEHLNADRSNVALAMAEYAGVSDLTEAEANGVKTAKDAGDAIAAVMSRRMGVKWTLGHTATPVKVFASGPGAERFTGNLDNTNIPQQIADALGLGPLEGAQ
jgi:alkaline phosphatase